jgi:hypothetical protein
MTGLLQTPHAEGVANLGNLPGGSKSRPSRDNTEVVAPRSTPGSGPSATGESQTRVSNINSDPQPDVQRLIKHTEVAEATSRKRSRRNDAEDSVAHRPTPSPSARGSSASMVINNSDSGHISTNSIQQDLNPPQARQSNSIYLPSLTVSASTELTVYFLGVTLTPIDLPDGYDELNFKPVMLRTETLGAILFFNIGCLVGLLLIVYKADPQSQFHSSYSNMRLVVRYVPTIVGTLTTVLFRSMRNTFVRIQPYMSMASGPNDRGSRGSKAIGAQYIPGIYFRRLDSHHQDWSRWAIIWGSLIIAQITGYKAAMFSASSTPDGKVIVTVHNSMAFVLISIYSVVILLTVMTLVKMVTNKTGLKWDPTTIADQLALFHGSNALGEFRALEQRHRETSFHLLANTSFRIGYWERRDGDESKIWYGIGKVTPSPSKFPQPYPSTVRFFEDVSICLFW